MNVHVARDALRDRFVRARVPTAGGAMREDGLEDVEEAFLLLLSGRHAEHARVLLDAQHVSPSEVVCEFGSEKKDNTACETLSLFGKASWRSVPTERQRSNSFVKVRFLRFS